MLFDLLVAVAALVGGVIAGVAGFGIGSVLTPALNVELPMRVAVAAVSIPHLCATAFRLWLLRADVSARVLLYFGLLSAAGGLVGALLQAQLSNRFLTILLAMLLFFAGVSALTGVSKHLRFEGIFSWSAGLFSGLLGGLVGNQGGIRAAALVGSGLDKKSFVATATATALLVDLARVPVYLFTSSADLAANSRPILLATLCVLAGTLIGYRLLRYVPERMFQKIVGALLCVLGLVMAMRAS